QPINRRAPPIVIDEIVPAWNQIAERAALMAERNATVHAARRLVPERLPIVRKIDLVPVSDPLGNRTGRRLLPLNPEKPGDLTHWPPRRSWRGTPPWPAQLEAWPARACNHAA